MAFIMTFSRFVQGGLKGFALCAMLLTTCSQVSAQLPPEVQADLLQDAIIGNINQKDFAAAKGNIAKYRALGVNVPPAIMIIDAKVAVALKESLRAVKILQDYFKQYGTKDSGYQNALTLYKKIKPALDQAAQEAEQAAQKIETMYTTAENYRVGRGVKQNFDKAARLYRRAGDQGHAPAQNALGVMYMNGEGIKANPVEAVRWFRRAADQGDPHGQFFLGLSYELGEGVEQNKYTAHSWYRKAGNQGHERGAQKISDCLNCMAIQKRP